MGFNSLVVVFIPESGATTIDQCSYNTAHGNRRNFQKWTILPRDTMSPAGICVTLWDTENITTDSTIHVEQLYETEKNNFLKDLYIHVLVSTCI